MNHLRNALLVVLMSCVFQNTHAAKPSLKLPYADGTSWMLMQAYNVNLHVGTDYYALDFTQSGCDAWDEPILAIAGGTVEVQTYAPDGYGNNILINHGDGYKSRYAHLNSISVTNGQTVIQGEEIGRCGNSGNVSGQSCESHPGTHLHLVLYYNGQAEIMEPMSGYTGFTAGQWYTSDNTGYTYKCSYVSQNPSGQYNMTQSQTATFEVKFKNEGNTTWYNNATSYPNDYVELKSCGIDGTVMGSFLYDASWLNTESPCSMVEASVAPGDTATFTFTGKIDANASTGLKLVYFRINHSTGGLLQDWGGMNFAINVEPPPPLPSEYHAKAMVSGDFDNDGAEDDLACIYDYPGNECRIHVWLSDGTEFDYQGPTGWYYEPSGYPSENVPHAVAGDFDGDGYKDDIVALYDYDEQPSGKMRSCFHVWIGTGTSLTYQGPQGWWIFDGYDANAVVDLASGDWDADGDDDLAAMYDYPNDETSIHVWLSDGSSFDYQGSNGWWHVSSGYESANVHYLLSGDVDNDGDDELSAFYDYGLVSGKYRTRIHVWASNRTSFVYQGGGGWWTVDGYNMNDVTEAVSGDFNNDSKTDLATFYDYGLVSGKYRTRIHVWLSTGSEYTYQGGGGWWTVDGYNAQSVIHGLSGYFNSDSYMDIVSAYDYNDGDTSRFHVFTSTGSAFTYQGPSGWWNFTGYPLPKIADGVSGESESAGTLPTMFSLSQNYPNPFNPVTTISYILPSATHVRLDVFNILGQNVQTLVDQHQTAGEHTVLWDSKKFSSGVYLYRIQAGEVIETKKMMLLK